MAICFHLWHCLDLVTHPSLLLIGKIEINCVHLFPLVALSGSRHTPIFVINYEGESIRNRSNLFPVEILLFFFDVIALKCDALKPTVFKCHQPRIAKVRVLSIDPLINFRQDFFVRPEMTLTDILYQDWGDRKKSSGARSGEKVGCDINSYPFRSTATIATFECCPVAANTFRELTSAFLRMAVLSWSSKFA